MKRKFKICEKCEYCKEIVKFEHWEFLYEYVCNMHMRVDVFGKIHYNIDDIERKNKFEERDIPPGCPYTMEHMVMEQKHE